MIQALRGITFTTRSPSGAKERVELLYKPVKVQELRAVLLRLLGHTADEEPEEIVLTSGKAGDSSFN